MTKIIIHNPCNEYTKNYRYYNLFWDEFTLFLKKHFDVYENRYYVNAHKERFPVKLIKSTNNDFLLLDCEYVIENAVTGEFVILSVADDLTHGILNEKSNPFLKKVLVSQFLPEKIEHHVGNFLEKYYPWTYFKSSIVDIEPYYNKRKEIKEFIDKLYFKGTSLSDRPILNYIDKSIITEFKPINQEFYYDDIIKHSIALSVDGRGEFCYRDVECFGLGVPVLRFEYKSKFYDDLIPNYHYISIPRPDDMSLYRTGNERHAKLIEQRYFEVINDSEYLKFISANARNYYEKNFELNSVIHNTFNILELNKWKTE